MANDTKQLLERIEELEAYLDEQGMWICCGHHACSCGERRKYTGPGEEEKPMVQIKTTDIHSDQWISSQWIKARYSMARIWDGRLKEAGVGSQRRKNIKSDYIWNLKVLEAMASMLTEEQRRAAIESTIKK